MGPAKIYFIKKNIVTVPELNGLFVCPIHGTHYFDLLFSHPDVQKTKKNLLHCYSDELEYVEE